MNIRTSQDHTGYAPRRDKWAAYDDDTYDEGAPLGLGPTEEAAIADLLAQIEDKS